MSVVQCRYFNGYKPCGRASVCDEPCSQQNIPTINILLVHLGAIGAVVRSTTLLESIHKKYPGCRLIWVTDAPSHHLLKNNPLIDQVYTTSESDLLELSTWEFDITLCVDKSRKAAGILKRVQAEATFGFTIDGVSGAVMPVTEAARELWEIGLNDHRKFFVNKKYETQLVHEALDLGVYQRSDYNLPLTVSEAALSLERKRAWSQNSNLPVIGLNTGCSSTIPAKKLTVQFHRIIVQKLIELGYHNIVLLGGPEDTERNMQIADGINVIQSPTTLGLRDGLVSVDACDIILTGDSLGMHLAIARKKYVVAWFGPTCAHEIDLFDRGQSLMTKAECAPCWKRTCSKEIMCYDQVDLNEVITAIQKGEAWHRQNQISLFKQPFLETSY